MKKQYIDGLELLEVGFNNISAHLGWLLRTIIIETTGSTDAVASLVYNRDIPKDVWGIFNGASRSIVINLEQHFNHALEAIQDKKSMHTSIRVLILHDILDSCAHEAWHAKMCNEGDDWAVSNLDEDGARAHAESLSWEFAELWDVNVETFGQLLDALLHSLYKDFKEDVQEDDCKEWKKLQYHMLENDVNYYNPDRGIEIRSIREVFSAQCQPEMPWIDTDSSLFTSYSVNEVVSIPSGVTETKIISEPAEVVETVAEPAIVEPIAPVAEVIETVQPTTMAANYDPLGDSACDMVDPFADDITEVAAASPVIPVQTTPVASITAMMPAATITPVAPIAVENVQPAINVQQIQQIAEKVLRRMFHHVHTKCEFNTAGGYNNTNAVLEPISIADIEGASELFAKQDTLDDMGVFAPRATIGNFIKGLPTAEGIPRYTFYLNIGGALHKRVYIAQNPNKMKGGVRTAWAQKAINGGRIMMLLADGAGITAHTELEAGQTLGQEKFVIWEKK